MKPLVFHFEFYLTGIDQKQLVKAFGFVVSKSGIDLLTTDSNKESSLFNQIYDKISDEIEKLGEEFGNHDFCTDVDDRIEAIGFDSGDIDDNDIPLLMEKWRHVFIEFCGDSNVSRVVELGPITNLSSYQIYEKTLERRKI